MPTQTEDIVSHQEALADVLGVYMAQSGYTPGQLAKLSGIPKPTIVNWLEGRVKRPRVVDDLLQIGAVLHLPTQAMSRLLQAAGHPPLTELRATAVHTQNHPLQTLLQPWSAVNPTPTPRPSPFQVTADLPHFVGRTTELAQLRTLLLAAIPRPIISIQGMAGVGKTALAAHLAYQLRPNFPDGVLWARVDTSDPMAILGTFANAYGADVSQYGDLNSRSRLVRELLAHKQALMVLDSAQTSAQVLPLLPPTGSCAVIITTRRHDLFVTHGAHRLTLSPFSPHRAESLALFARVLGAERTADERPYLQELADYLGHLPLAVDIAAARLAYEPGWSTAVFLQRIRQEKRRLGELTFEDQNVRLSFNLSFQTLNPAQQTLFSILGCFTGEDFSAAATAAAAGVSLEEAQDDLRRLYLLSLIQQGRPSPIPENGRFQLHPLVQTYARHMLAQLPPAEVTAVWQRLTHYYAQFAAQHTQEFALLTLELANMLPVWRQAAALGWHTEFVQGINTIYPFLEATGLYEQSHELLTAASATAVAQEATPAMHLHYHLGRLAYKQGEYIEAETQYEQALALARAQQQAQTTSHLLRSLGMLAARRGDYVLADAYYKEGLALARSMGGGGIVSNFLRGLGVQAYMRGDFARAEAFYEEGLSLMELSDQAAQEGKGRGAMLWGLGMLAQEQDDLTQAEAYYQQALALARTLGQSERIVLLLRALASVSVARQQPASAHTWLAEALQMAEAIGHRWQTARILGEWGEVQLELEPTEALSAFQRLYELARVLQSQELVAVALFGLARVTAVTGDWAQASQFAAESLDTFTAIGHFNVQEVQEWLNRVRD